MTPTSGMLVADLAGGLEAVHLRHPDVDERDLGLGLLDELRSSWPLAASPTTSMPSAISR